MNATPQPVLAVLEVTGEPSQQAINALARILLRAVEDETDNTPDDDGGESASDPNQAAQGEDGQ